MATLVNGALPDETIEVKDIFANTIAKGKADTINLDMQYGPYYIIGSAPMQMVAATTKQTTPGQSIRLSQNRRSRWFINHSQKNEQKSLAFTIPRHKVSQASPRPATRKP